MWKWTVLANFAAQALGYNSLKEHQIEVVLAVAGFCSTSNRLWEYPCLPLDLHTDDRSIVVVLTPLTAIIQDQVMKCYNLFPGVFFFIKRLETGYITSTTDARQSG